MKNENEKNTIEELKAEIIQLEARAASALDWLRRASVWSSDARATSAINVARDILAADVECGEGTRPDARSRALHDAWLVTKATVAMREIAAGRADPEAIAKKFILLLDTPDNGD